MQLGHKEVTDGGAEALSHLHRVESLPPSSPPAPLPHGLARSSGEPAGPVPRSGSGAPPETRREFPRPGVRSPAVLEVSQASRGAKEAAVVGTREGGIRVHNREGWVHTPGQ